jgi:hypothetical protein
MSQGIDYVMDDMDDIIISSVAASVPVVPWLLQ